MRLVVQTTEGVFRSDEFTPTEEERSALVQTLGKLSAPDSIQITVYGNQMYFYMRHVVWVQVMENDEPF